MGAAKWAIVRFQFYSSGHEPPFFYPISSCRHPDSQKFFVVDKRQLKVGTLG